MATTTRIYCLATKYGTSSYGTNGRAYIGAGYRTRATFPAVRSIAAIGDANIVISKAVLYLYRDDGGATTVTAGCSADSAWGAAVDAYGSGVVPASSGWYPIDITACAQDMLEYGGNWNLHLTGSGVRVRCGGAGTGTAPCIDIVWEYAASTITTGTETSTLGEAITFTIAPQEGDVRFTLSYSFGNESGIIGETTGNTVIWTPPLAELATEMPNAEMGEMRVTMRVYDANGNQIRSEVLLVTVTVPETAALKFQGGTFSVTAVNALEYTDGTALLQGKTHLSITPVVDTGDAYGATIVSLRADIANEGNAQVIEWQNLTETDDQEYTGAAMNTAILGNAGSVSVTLVATDSRGREAALTRTFTVHAYANPAVTAFAVERYEPVYDENEQIIDYAASDTGENVWVTLRASCTDVVVSGASLNDLSWTISATHSDGTQATYSGSAAQSVSIENDRTVITALVPAADAVEYTVSVTDTAGYAAYQYDSVAPGRANFALSATKYGASFGCMPKGTEASPMLESAYPFYAYGGIDGVTNYEGSEEETPFRWINGKPIYRYCFEASTSVVNGQGVIGTLPSTPETVISIRGAIKWNNVWFNAFHPNAGGDMAVVMNNDNNVYLQCAAYYSGVKAVVAVIEYTKGG